LIGVLSFKVLIIDQGKSSVVLTYLFYLIFIKIRIFLSYIYTMYVVAID
jgi:hypothetical protein